MDQKIAVVAIGGNALIPDPENISIESEREAVRAACQGILHLIQSGYRVVIIHGNGPQVGFNLRRSELTREALFDLPLDVCGSF
ncbi:MAG: carbamate kinase, partial [Chloroflexota bacterium]